MDPNLKRKIICALDTGSLDEAISTIQRTSAYVGAYKIGHALTLPNGLGVLDKLREAGAERIFLDLKFHDIPNSVAIGVREAARRGVWMMTLHLSGGPAMITAAVEEAQAHGELNRPMLVGVSVLTSLDQRNLTEDLGVDRSIPEHMERLSRIGMDCGLDGVVTSVHECAHLKKTLGHVVLVVPGIRPHAEDRQDQNRVGDGQDALTAGADYMVLGRAFSAKPDPEQALRDLGFTI